MKVSVRDITSDGLDIDKVIKPSEIGLEENDLEIQKPFNVYVHIERVDNFVLVYASIKAIFEFFCARCLKQFEKEDTKKFQFEYEIMKGLEEIDYGEDIRQELILLRSTRDLCRPDCRGICKNCGTNLNEEVCQCKSK